MEQKKSILLVYYKLFKPGGVAKVLTNLANALSEQGYTVEILLLMNEREHFYPLNPNIKVHNIDTFSHWAWKICEFNNTHLRFIPKRNNINAYIHHIGVFLMLRNWMRKNHQNYDTIISAWYKLSSFLSLNKKANRKTIAWEHVTYQTGGILFNDILRRYYKNLKGIVCINSPAINYYQKFNKTYFIPNIIGEPFENQPEINFEKKENLISFVGRLDREKNVISLLEIFKEANIPSDWKLQIIGDGNEKNNLEKFVEENQLKNRVIFHGTKNSNEILELLRKSKIFGFTSLKEALPTVLVEAMFCSNAIISYNCNYGPSDIVKNNSGFLIDVNNKEDFIQKLEMLTNSDEKLEKMMENASKEAQNWKQNEILKKWQEII
jgi:glycosyltransferase involved in cell wall biosynthesis